METVTLTGNVTGVNVAPLVIGARLTLQICQDSAGGHTWSWPSAVHGGMTIDTTASTCSQQEFVSYNGTTLVATSPGAINVAP